MGFDMAQSESVPKSATSAVPASNPWVSVQVIDGQNTTLSDTTLGRSGNSESSTKERAGRPAAPSFADGYRPWG